MENTLYNSEHSSVRVQLVDYTEHALDKVWCCYRTCYSDLSHKELQKEAENLSSKQKHDFVLQCIKKGHVSPLEHAHFTFALSGFSRAASHQLVRHRIASYSQQSQRYVSNKNFGYIMPPSIAKDPELKEKYQLFMAQTDSFYQELCQKVPKEDARMVLPQAVSTTLVLSMNGRALWEFFEKRCCTKAQWEIRDIALLMLDKTREVFSIFEDAGPKCVHLGYCPENRYYGRCSNLPCLENK